MARGDIGSMAIKVGLVFVAYQAIKGGALDNWVPGLGRSLGGLGAGLAGADPGSGGGSSRGGLPASYRGMNNFGAVANQWRRERSEAFQDPRDWNAFARHLSFLHGVEHGSGVPGDWSGISAPAGW